MKAVRFFIFFLFLDSSSSFRLMPRIGWFVEIWDPLAGSRSRKGQNRRMKMVAHHIDQLSQTEYHKHPTTQNISEVNRTSRSLMMQMWIWSAASTYHRFSHQSRKTTTICLLAWIQEMYIFSTSKGENSQILPFEIWNKRRPIIPIIIESQIWSASQRRCNVFWLLMSNLKCVFIAWTSSRRFSRSIWMEKTEIKGKS